MSEKTTIHNIINTVPVLHVSFNDPKHPFPVVLPMLGCTADFSNPEADPESSPQDIYIHGYVSGRMFRSGKDAEGEGLPITIAATCVASVFYIPKGNASYEFGAS